MLKQLNKTKYWYLTNPTAKSCCGIVLFYYNKRFLLQPRAWTIIAPIVLSTSTEPKKVWNKSLTNNNSTLGVLRYSLAPEESSSRVSSSTLNISGGSPGSHWSTSSWGPEGADWFKAARDSVLARYMYFPFLYTTVNLNGWSWSIMSWRRLGA